LAAVCSLSVYVPALTEAFETDVVPLVPAIVDGPVAVRGKLATEAVPPLSFVTVLTSVRCEATSSLLIVQVTLLPRPTVTWPFVTVLLPQLHVLAV